MTTQSLYVVHPPVMPAPAQQNATPATQDSGTPKPTTVSAKNAHDMLFAIVIESVAVFALVLIAGTGRGAARFAVGLMLLFLFMQGIGHVNPVVSFIGNHPLTRKGG